MEGKHLRVTLRWLRKEFPTPLPVKVRQEYFDMSHFGDTKKLKKHFVIRINKNLSPIAAEVILMHEWAHVVSWSTQELSNSVFDHEDMWGIAYARIWRKYSAEMAKLEALNETAAVDGAGPDQPTR